jgi:hypothetical protein
MHDRSGGGGGCLVTMITSTIFIVGIAALLGGCVSLFD